MKDRKPNKRLERSRRRVAFISMEFYREFMAGDSLESALYAARRKRSAAGSDPTAFSLFGNPTSLDFFQALPVTA